MQKLLMHPETGERLLRFVGDRVGFTLSGGGGEALPKGWRAVLRTNLGRARVLRHEIIHAHTGKFGLADASWRDIPMECLDGEWRRDLALSEVGFFRAKAYAVDARGRQHWPDGPDVGISIHPDSYRSANTVYCAFTRMFGQGRAAHRTRNPLAEVQLAELDAQGYTVIPPSGKLRDLQRELPHVIDTLGCRILHLLPVTPTPTTSAKFGRFGSPYAVQDFTAIDPALVEFDKRTTGVEQFCELTYATHLKGGRVFLDVVANHTGWGAKLQEEHPQWYLRNEKGEFASPGAWGVTWEDLVELDHRNPELWEYLADVFLVWCRRGVDGFRCDAGYKIPVPAWQYITARVLEEFPETVFLLEGLGGSWQATENLLTDGGMQWAYSELFQNYSGREVASYLDYSLRQSQRLGLYVHYSETHDNERLAQKGRDWSLLRNRLCALSSSSGGYGFTCGVEWLASEKLNVHSSRGLAWGNPDNIVPELRQLNGLLTEHPCFLDGAELTRLSADDSPVYALSRVSVEGLDRVLVLVNTDLEKAHPLTISRKIYRELGEPALDLLTLKTHQLVKSSEADVYFQLEPGECFCLAHSASPHGLSGEAYRRARAQTAWAVTALSQVRPSEEIGPYDWRELAERVSLDAKGLLSSLPHLDRELAQTDLLAALDKARTESHFPNVVTWTLLDERRITPVPPDHWLQVEDASPFRAKLNFGSETRHAQSIPVGQIHIASFAPPSSDGANSRDARLELERYAKDRKESVGQIRFLAPAPCVAALEKRRLEASATAPVMADDLGLVLLTNGLGGMARMAVDLGQVYSKYDCVLAANLHSAVPVDRHIFVKRVRVWVVADGFISPFNAQSLVGFRPGPPARWRFVAGAGQGRAVEIDLIADMLPDKNTTVLRFVRPAGAPATGEDLPAECAVSLTVRVDLVDRNFHWETRRQGGSEYHFHTHSHPMSGRIGFEFTPGQDRQLRVFSDGGSYHHEPEWCMGVEHPVDASRGQAGQEDAYSPGWFELPMTKGGSWLLTLTAERADPSSQQLSDFETERVRRNESAVNRAELDDNDEFGRQLALAVQAFVVRRDQGKTVIADYPWFLDWGRDSLICARGLLAAGLHEEVRQLLMVFGRFAQNGTLPNTIHGEDASNRDTSDAPLWYGLVCEECSKPQLQSPKSKVQSSMSVGADISLGFYQTQVDARGRTIADVLREIGANYVHGTPNGIRMDPASALIWSPSHFTWMDTNYPAATPREGYPVEIQVLWICLLRQLAGLGTHSQEPNWGDLAERAVASLERMFWLEDRGYLADLLIAKRGQPAAEAVVDNALRSNYLLAVSLGLLTGDRARRSVEAARRYLVVPGALRSLAPLPVAPLLPVRNTQGVLLNDPLHPYSGRYEGDEDTRRKPAYHNGTAWTWTFPVFCEALARAWDFSPEAVTAARAYLASMDRLLVEGCLGQIPEIIDGDIPHTQRGCDAQAWGATEALRVWKLLRI